MKVIAVNGKVLLANGKAVKPTEIKADNFVDTTCKIAENNNVSSSWSPSVTAEEYIPPKYYYNGVLLPEIPADVLASYPYTVMAVNEEKMQYQLLVSTSKWYFDGTNVTNESSDNEPFLYAYAEDTAWKEGTAGDYVFTQEIRPLIWSNHDIPNGSATATEIYFEGSEPVLAE